MTTAMFKTGMNRALLNRDFFQTILDRAYGPNAAQPTSWVEQDLDSSASILSSISSAGADDDDDDLDREGSLTSKERTSSDKTEEACPMNDMTGHFLYKIEYNAIHSSSASSHPSVYHPSNTTYPESISISATSRLDSHPSAEGQLWMVIKSKPIDTALIELTNIMAQLQGGEIADQYDQVKDLTGFRNSHIREIELAELAWQVGGPMARISTKVYNVLRNDTQQLYALCLEYLDPAMGNVTHMNSTEHALTTWSPDDIHLALRDMASFHAQFLGQEDKLLKMSFLENPTRPMTKVLRPAYEAMVKTNRKNDPELFSESLTRSMLDYLAHSDEYWAVLENSPRTLIHGDFNTRNICLRMDQSTGAQTLCVYDWELACCHVPQRDVVEFLSFVLPSGSTEWSHYIEYHRLALKQSFESMQSLVEPSSRKIKIPSPREYMEVAKIALMEFASLRVAMYGISNSFKQVEWLPRILSSVEEQVKRMGPLRPSRDRVHFESKL
ncbi:hypothetical protein BGZ65_003502 [Modicella reniformis]|uniref:Aminoglycoside phosphotransferase domain-containing protein n=1 Tax=Modicella reniformis TaxID=1440133 RepID=A0A9P6LZE8_9FUNG|nr:hypothetical protein BGZ65_003502 [Modicella reniformis]